jgi:SAM-dependent methyltransferase
MKSASKVKNQTLDRGLAEKFRHKFVLDMAALSGMVCTNLGDRLGLYRKMAEMGPVSTGELADATGTHERYIKEWLINQAAGGYVEYHSQVDKFFLPPEHAAVLADEESEFFCAGGVEAWIAFVKAEHRIAECFKTGTGMRWGEHDPAVFRGTERFFRAAYKSLLLTDWIPSIKGLQERLKSGIKVADVGCGFGTSTLVMAKEFPRSQFFGFDNHAPSIEEARKRAAQAGLSERVTFTACEANAFPGEDYGLIAYFDCLHDMGDPVSTCKRARQALAKDGVVMIVEPMGGKTMEENFNPIGRSLSGASILCCLPNAIASGNHSLGTIASDDALREVVISGGFKHFERVAETPFNRIFEARI